MSKGSWPRGNFSSWCIKPCANRDLMCDECYKDDCYVPIKKDVDKRKP